MLIVVRHGRTAHNASGLLLGRLDPPLDELGRAQAAALAAEVGPVDRVISSPLLRTRETAEAFGHDVEIDERWIELDYGEYDGMPLGEVPAEIWARWRADVDFCPPGGETLRQLGVRVCAALDELADRGLGGGGHHRRGHPRLAREGGGGLGGRCRRRHLVAALGGPGLDHPHRHHAPRRGAALVQRDRPPRP